MGGANQTGGVFDLKPRCAEWSVYDIKVPRAIQKHKGAFTPDANEALRTNDLHVKSMQRRDRESCGAIERLMCHSRE